MDRITYLSYLLFQVNDENVKKAAIKLVNGDVSIKELKKDRRIESHLRIAEKLLKKNTLNKNDVYKFVESNLYVY